MDKTSAVTEVTEKLLALADPSYRDFSAALTPTVDPSAIIGVRMPALRRLAAELADTPEAEAFCQTLPHRYFEEYNLHGCLLESGAATTPLSKGLTRCCRMLITGRPAI